MTAKCRCIDAHTLDCYWFTPDRTAYQALVGRVVKLTGERDRARTLAVALEQRLDRAEGLVDFMSEEPA